MSSSKREAEVQIRKDDESDDDDNGGDGVERGTFKKAEPTVLAERK